MHIDKFQAVLCNCRRIVVVIRHFGDVSRVACQALHIVIAATSGEASVVFVKAALGRPAAVGRSGFRILVAAVQRNVPLVGHVGAVACLLENFRDGGVAHW